MSGYSTQKWLLAHVLITEPFGVFAKRHLTVTLLRSLAVVLTLRGSSA